MRQTCVAGDSVSRFCMVFLISVMAASCKSDEYNCSDLEVGGSMPNMAEFYGVDAEVSSRAIQDYYQKIESGSVDPGRGYYCLGKSFYDTGEDERAIVLFTKSINADADHFLPYYGRARAASETGECSQAIDDYTHLIDQGYRNDQILLLRAREFVECDHTENARRDLDEYEQRVAAQRRADLYYEIQVQLGGDSSKYSEYADQIAFFEGEVEKFSGLSPCTNDMDYCSMPRLISAVDSLTSLLCKVGETERAREIFETYQVYRDPAPEEPPCLSAGKSGTVTIQEMSYTDSSNSATVGSATGSLTSTHDLSTQPIGSGR